MRYWLFPLLLPLSACMEQAGDEGGPAGRPLLGPLKLRGTGPRLAVGEGQVVVIRSDGTLWAWGDNRLGQVGIHRTAPENDYVTRPALVDAGRHWVAVAAGARHCLALRGDGTLWAWGPNNDGVLGTGPDIALLTGASAPVQVGTATDWVAVAAGRFHSLARRADGSLWNWGGNSSAQLGSVPWPGTDPMWYNVPKRVGPAGARWVAFAGGGTMTLAVQADGALYSWGSNDTDQLGRPGLGNPLDSGAVGTGVYPPPQRVPGGPGAWRRVATGWGAGISRDGALWLWGQRHGLTRVGTDTSWVQLAAGSSHCLALRRDGSLWAWSSDGLGRQATGNPDTDTGFAEFARVGHGRAWRDIAAGSNTSMGLQADGSCWLWGEEPLTKRTASEPAGPAPLRQPTRVAFPPAPGSN